jgi:guanylate kinase
MSTVLKGKLFIISGPSGVGKGTVISELKKAYPGFVFPISHTTREIRPGEKDGETYHYITKDEFKKGIEQGEFLEWAQVHQQNYYGTLKKPIMDALADGRIIVREVDVQGFHSIKAVVPAENLVTIFIKAKSKEELIARITRRGKLPEDEMKRRLESMEKELKDAHLFDHQVWSLENRIPQCVGAVVKIIKDEAEKAGLKI